MRSFFVLLFPRLIRSHILQCFSAQTASLRLGRYFSKKILVHRRLFTLSKFICPTGLCKAPASTNFSADKISVCPLRSFSYPIGKGALSFAAAFREENKFPLLPAKYPFPCLRVFRFSTAIPHPPFRFRFRTTPLPRKTLIGIRRINNKADGKRADGFFLAGLSPPKRRGCAPSIPRILRP